MKIVYQENEDLTKENEKLKEEVKALAKENCTLKRVSIEKLGRLYFLVFYFQLYFHFLVIFIFLHQSYSTLSC